MKKPFIYALAAVLYIVTLVISITTIVTPMQDKPDTIIIPMVMLSLFVLSAAIMGFLFLSEPLSLFLDNRKQEAVTFFGKTVGFFAVFALILLVLMVIF